MERSNEYSSKTGNASENGNWTAGRIALRKIQKSDADVLMELNNDPQVSRVVVGTPVVVTLNEQLRWMERLAFEKNTVRFMIDFFCQPVGTVIISDIDEANRSANLNIKLLPAFWKKGIASAAVALALDYCFEYLRLECMTAHVLSYNFASLSLFSKSGFKNEGLLRSRVVKDNLRCDLVSFSMLRSEYFVGKRMRNEKE